MQAKYVSFLPWLLSQFKNVGLGMVTVVWEQLFFNFLRDEQNFKRGNVEKEDLYNIEREYQNALPIMVLLGKVSKKVTKQLLLKVWVEQKKEKGTSIL